MTTTNEVSISDVGHEVITVELWDDDVMQIIRDLDTVEDRFGALPNGLAALREAIKKALFPVEKFDPITYCEIHKKPIANAYLGCTDCWQDAEVVAFEIQPDEPRCETHGFTLKHGCLMCELDTNAAHDQRAAQEPDDSENGEERI